MCGKEPQTQDEINVRAMHLHMHVEFSELPLVPTPLGPGP